MNEEWRAVEGYEGLYEVSNLGMVKSLERLVENNGGLQAKHERILKGSISPNRIGYNQVVLCKNGKTKTYSVHRLVAQAFIPNPEQKPVVDHIDTNPSNNRVDNLRWVTTQENCMNPITRKKNSESKEGHPCYLEKHTEETKRIISSKLRGRTMSEEHRSRLSEAHMGRNHTEETKRKMSASRMGHEVSEETRRKISESHKGLLKGKHWTIEGGKRKWL